MEKELKEAYVQLDKVTAQRNELEEKVFELTKYIYSHFLIDEDRLKQFVKVKEITNGKITKLKADIHLSIEHIVDPSLSDINKDILKEMLIERFVDNIKRILK